MSLSISLSLLNYSSNSIKIIFIIDEIQCQNELLDLLPAIEEANQISIMLDKKVMFKAIAVSAQARFLIVFLELKVNFLFNSQLFHFI